MIAVSFKKGDELSPEIYTEFCDLLKQVLAPESGVVRGGLSELTSVKFGVNFIGVKPELEPEHDPEELERVGRLAV